MNDSYDRKRQRETTVKRDDSRTVAEQCVATMRLVMRTLPTGYGKAQEADVDAVRLGLDSCIKVMERYIERRKQMS